MLHSFRNCILNTAAKICFFGGGGVIEKMATKLLESVLNVMTPDSINAASRMQGGHHILSIAMYYQTVPDLNLQCFFITLVSSFACTLKENWRSLFFNCFLSLYFLVCYITHLYYTFIKTYMHVYTQTHTHTYSGA